ncbi:MAG: sialate O-acetylesterase [Verrucomicrobiaceae bacterium]|nr:MAG: sialate O-acetylesterase [Verrucomicrobiaceae bacterium]
MNVLLATGNGFRCDGGRMKPTPAVTTAVFLGLAASLSAEVRLPPVFSSHMVLQRDKTVPVWGQADAGEKVAVSIGGQTQETTAGTDGKWMVKLAPMPANAVPQTLEVRGGNKIELTDVLIGEVWLGSGQSNMEWPVKAAVNGAAETETAKFPTIRLLNVPKTTVSQPVTTLNAAWTECTPQTAAGFSAVLFFMGRELNRELNVPVGLINSSWGGSRIEPWTPLEGFALVPSQRDNVRAIRATIPGTGEYNNSMSAWLGNVEQWARDARAGLQKNQPVPAIPEQPGPPPQGSQGLVGLYNGMIHPLVPYAIRGAVWYQGESNNGEGMGYLDRKKALIGGWRQVWGQGDFPFYTVQLAPYNYGNGRENTSLAEIWEAQNATLTEIPNTGLVVTNDISNLADIHPTNKQEVGRRLALTALAKEYGRANLVYSGPLFAGKAVEGGKIRVKFSHTGSGLASRDGKPLDWFEIAGEDGKFVPAEAVIDGTDVMVSSAQVPQPVKVRLAWSQLGTPNLMNKEGLPASAFRSL